MENPTHTNPYAAPEADLTDEPKSVERVLATRWSRLLAKIADILANGTALLPLAIGYYFLIPEYEFNLMSAIFGAIGLFVGYKWIRYNLRMMSKNGQTFGKIALGIKVVRTDGTPVGLWRWIGYRVLPMDLISAVPIVKILGLIDILAIFRESRLCLHDQIADTKVVKV